MPLSGNDNNKSGGTFAPVVCRLIQPYQTDQVTIFIKVNETQRSGFPLPMSLEIYFLGKNAKVGASPVRSRARRKSSIGQLDVRELWGDRGVMQVRPAEVPSHRGFVFKFPRADKFSGPLAPLLIVYKCSLSI